jgi:hypothetical protein
MEKSLWVRAKHNWKAVRAFLAQDNNPLSWLANLAIAFVVIKFILYPLLGFVFGSPLPVVAVVSSSMDHDALDNNICGKTVFSEYDDSFDTYWKTCGQWYEERGISKEEFRKYPFRNGFNKGDIMVILGPSRTTIKQGDVLVFQAQQQYPIIHRIVSVGNTSAARYATKGDHNIAQIQEYVLLNADGTPMRCEYEGNPAPCFIGQRVTADTPGSVALLDEGAIPENAVIGKAVLRIPLLGYVKIWFTDIVVWTIGLFH